MSVKALTWAFDQPVAGNEKVVLLCLADHFSDETSQCWPSINRLIQRSHVSRSTVLRCISSLEKDGYITVENRTRENGSKTSNLYKLNLDRVSQEVSGSVNLKPPPSVTVDTTPSVTFDTTPSVTVDTTRTVIKNRKKEPSSISFDADFEEFWAAYPKRVGPNPRAKALEKYKQMRKAKVSHETLMAGVNRLAESRKNEDPAFTPMAATWLNQRRWEDEEIVAPAMPSVDIMPLAKVYPGAIGNAQDAISALAKEVAQGVTMDELCQCAIKYAQQLKDFRADGLQPAPLALDHWLRWGKWRQMQEYDLVRVGPDRRLTLRPIKRKGVA